jgi:hypothetical protein
MTPKRKKTDTVALQVRLREYLRARLAAEARRNEVSLNAEIVRRLEASLEKDEQNVMARQIQIIGDRVGALADLITAGQRR